MKKLVQTTLDERQYADLKEVSEANASTEATALRMAVKIGLEQLKREIAARMKQVRSHQPAA